jgi:hypothetical protein
MQGEAEVPTMKRHPNFQRIALAALACLLVGLTSCKGRYTVNLTGKISDFSRGDSVFVTLTDGWENATSSPDTFAIDKRGSFSLRLTIGSYPPPVTFVKNDYLYARLRFYDMNDFSPVVVDEVSGKVFKLTVESDSCARADIQL